MNLSRIVKLVIALLLLVALMPKSCLAQVMLPNRHAQPHISLEPPFQSDLIVWLAASDFDGKVADGASVTNWIDRTVYKNDFTNTAAVGTHPVYSSNQVYGWSAIRFECTNQQRFVSVNKGASAWYNSFSQFSVFFALKSDVTCGNSSGQQAPGNGLHNFTYVDGGTGTSGENLYPASGGTDLHARFMSKYANSLDVGNALINLQSWHVMDTASAANDYRMHLNNLLQFGFGTNLVGAPVNDTYCLLGESELITTLPSTTLYFFNGWIAEMLIYKNNFSDANASLVTSYLATKYGLTMSAKCPGTGSSAGLVSTNGVVAYWRLDEDYGDRADAMGGNTVYDSSYTGALDGQICNAAHMATGSHNFLSTTNSSLSLSNQDFTIGGWVRRTSNPSPSNWALWGQWDIGGDASYKATITSNWFAFVSTNGTQFASVNSSSVYPNITNNLWYFFVMWHDATANQLGLSVNAWTPITASMPAAVHLSTKPFAIGRSDTTTTTDMNGDLDEVFLAHRVLNTNEIAKIYTNTLKFPW